MHYASSEISSISQMQRRQNKAKNCILCPQRVLRHKYYYRIDNYYNLYSEQQVESYKINNSIKGSEIFCKSKDYLRLILEKYSTTRNDLILVSVILGGYE